MERQEILDKNLSLVFGLLFPLYCAMFVHIIHQTNVPHQQRYPFNHKEQHSPSISKTTP